MSPDDLRALRKDLNLTQRQLAEALDLDVELVRQWEKGERFPTRANCTAMEALRKSPPRRLPKNPSPLELLADPGFFLLVRKLLAHPKLRAEAEKLASNYPDPLDDRD